MAKPKQKKLVSKKGSFVCSFPYFTLMEKDGTRKYFDSYADLYAFAKSRKDGLLSRITADAKLICNFGSFPLLYNMKTKRVYTLQWKPI